MSERGEHASPRDEWIERMAAFFVEEGLPLIAGRLLGYLLICEPAERTAAELSSALSASSGSVSTNIRLLLRLGLVSRSTRKGREAALYRIVEQRWVDLVRRRFERVAAARELTSAGLRLLSGESHRAARLRVVDDLYGWLGDELPELWRRWEAR
jgi:DNA-binding transcriptional regulator GbsR (MarR family)